MASDSLNAEETGVHKIRILIADDHAVVIAGLSTMLAKEPDFEVVAEARDGVTAVEECRRHRPEIVLMDLSMPRGGGIRAIEAIHRHCPESKVLVVTMHDNEAYVRHAFRSGAAGYVLKTALAEELIIAVRAVCAHQTYVTPALANALSVPRPAAGSTAQAAVAFDVLTPFECAVVREVAQGRTTSEIARRLSSADDVIKTSRGEIAAKLGLRTRADFVRLALGHKLLNE